MVEGGFEVFGDFTGEDVWGGKACRVLEALVFEPEYIEVYFVSLHEFFIRENVEALGFFAVVAVLRIVAADEVLKVSIFQGIGFKGEVHVGPKVIYPEFIRPVLFAGRFAVKEENVCLDALGIEYTSGKSQKRVHVTFMQ